MTTNLIQPTTLVDLLRFRALKTPEKLAYTFLVDGESEEINLTYAELEQQARTIAAQLQSLTAMGDRALLLYPPGLDYIAAFFGCLYAGLIAVPTYPPRHNHLDSRLQAIVTDAQATVVLTTTKIHSDITPQLAHISELQNVHWLTTNNLTNDFTNSWQNPEIHSDTLAFLQYTSGSTGIPKGVMVSHGNVLHNSENLKQRAELTPNSVSVTWLPNFHDMGLIDGVLQPLYTGFRGIMMAPMSFLQQPIRWLNAISRYHVTHSGGPNFAYDLCVHKITPKQLENIDLSSWCNAYNGSEPIRPETLERFVHIFKPYGFQPHFFCPCYGLAENTVGVSGGSVKNEPIYHKVKAKALEKGIVREASNTTTKVKQLVGCGYAGIDTKIIIVNPKTLKSCNSDEVGEIWISGDSVAQGYWNRTTETKQTFQAYLADTGEGPFLRTGDLGFLKNDELFVTGRLKDLIIIRGNNYYPQDIEFTVEKSYPALMSGCSAAFSVEVNNEEHLVIVAEVERRYGARRQHAKKTSENNLGRRSGLDRRQFEAESNFDAERRSGSERRSGPERRSTPERRQTEIVPHLEPNLTRPFNMEEALSTIHQTVSEQHQIAVYAVILLRIGTIPKTSSGKIQRHACRERFLDGTLTIVGKWYQDLAVESPTLEEQTRIPKNLVAPSQPQTVTTIQNWIITKLSKTLKLAPTEINVQEPLAHYGVDSMMASNLSRELETWLGHQVSPAVMYEFPTIQAIAQYLANPVPLDNDRHLITPIPTTTTTPSLEEQVLANIDQLDDEKIDALLNEQLSVKSTQQEANN